jgi:ankyrin repeat protein
MPVKTTTSRRFNELYNEAHRRVHSRKTLSPTMHRELRVLLDLNSGTIYINQRTQETFLHSAAKKGHTTVLNFLLEAENLHDIDVNWRDIDGNTALYYACAAEKESAVNVLLSHDANPNIWGNDTPLIAIIQSQKIDKNVEANIVKALIAAGANVNTQMGRKHFSPLHYAVALRKTPIVQALIASGKADLSLVDINGQTVLHLGADYSNPVRTPQERTHMEEENKIAAYIIQHTNAINSQDNVGDTPLHTAISKNNLGKVELFLTKDYLFPQLSIFHIQNHLGMTAIHEAILHIKQEPKLLESLLSIATQADVQIKNNRGETILDFTDRLYNQAILVHSLLNGITLAANQLESVVSLADKQAPLATAINKLSELAGRVATMQLSEVLYKDTRRLLQKSLQISDINKENRLTNEDVHAVHRMAMNIVKHTQQFFDGNYIDALNNAKRLFMQEDYLVWKNQQLALPTSFPDLEIINTRQIQSRGSENYRLAQSKYAQGALAYNNMDFKTAIKHFKESIQIYKTHYSHHLSLAKAHLALGLAYLEDKTDVQRTHHAHNSIMASVDICYDLKQYTELETAYQILAKIYVSRGQASHHEEISKATLSGHLTHPTTHKEKLSAHLTLASLYQTLRERHLLISDIPPGDLRLHESFHYSEAYKWMQATHLDNNAHLVLQRETGIIDNAKLGTSNIIQCIAIVAYDPLTKKVLLSHFDKFSGPITFIKDLLSEFSGPHKIHIYLSGGSDHSDGGKMASYTNAHQVLKQLYAYKERFIIKSTDLGIADKPSPSAIVFDIESEKLVHALPNHVDNSLDSRRVAMGLSLIYKAHGDREYLEPLHKVYFSQTETERQIEFTEAQQTKIHAQYARYLTPSVGTTLSWHNNQLLHPVSMMRVILLTGHAAYDFRPTLLDTFTSDPSSLEYDSSTSDLSSWTQQPGQIHDVDLIDVLTTDARPQFAIASRPTTLIIDDDVQESLYADTKACFKSTRKRTAKSNCLFSKEDIDNINVADNKNNIEDINLHSSKLLNYIRTLDEPARRQVLQFSARCKISGEKTDLVQSLIRIEQLKPYSKIVSDISSSLMKGTIAKDTLAALIQGDAKTVAINLGFLGSNHAIGKLSELAASHGTRLLAQGKTLLGQSLKISSPFLSRAASGFIAYDLVNQIKALKTGDKDALVNVVGDSILLSVDLLEVGIEIAEISEAVIAEISSVTGPVGALISTSVIVGTQIYLAIRVVDRLDHTVHLTAWEKFKTGWRVFLGVAPEDYLTKMAALAAAYDRLLAEKLAFLKNNTAIKHVIFPAIASNTICQSKIVRTFCSWDDIPPILQCDEERYVCGETTFSVAVDNIAYFDKKRSDFQLERLKPNPPSGSELLCSPVGSDETVSGEGVFYCPATLGLTNSDPTAGKIAFFDLEEGKDDVQGFKNYSNFFAVKNGWKRYSGGTLGDFFSLFGKDITGILDGQEEIDTLELSGFQPRTHDLEIDCSMHLRYANKTLAIRSIENFIGRSLQVERVIANCDTHLLDMKGGTVSAWDSINIPSNNDCAYKLHILLQPYTELINAATQGNFTYSVSFGNGVVNAKLPSPMLGSSQKIATKHQIIFNATVADLAAIWGPSRIEGFDSLRYRIKFHFLSQDIVLPKSAHAATPVNNFTLDIQSFFSGNTLFYFRDGAELKIGKKNTYFFHIIQENISAIIDTYSAIARRLNMTCIIHNPKKSESVVIGHDKHEVIHTDPHALKSHLVGNGGENIFIVSPYQSSSIPEVILYRCEDSQHTDSLDLRTLRKALQTEFLKNTTEIFLRLISPIPPTKRNREGQDILIKVGQQLKQTKHVLKDTTIYLRNALIGAWYKKLHVMFQSVPMHIVGPLNNLRLQPLPLTFSKHYKLISLGEKDVDENTVIIIRRNFDEYRYDFFRDKDNLILTNANALNSDLKNGLCTIIFENFYKSTRLKTLSIQFHDKKIVLQDPVTLAEITAAANLTQWNTIYNLLYAVAFNDSATEMQMDLYPNKTNIKRPRAIADDNPRSQATSSAPRLQSWLTLFSMPWNFQRHTSPNVQQHLNEDSILERAEQYLEQHDRDERKRDRVPKKAMKKTEKLSFRDTREKKIIPPNKQVQSTPSVTKRTTPPSLLRLRQSEQLLSKKVVVKQKKSLAAEAKRNNQTPSAYPRMNNTANFFPIQHSSQKPTHLSLQTRPAPLPWNQPYNERAPFVQKAAPMSLRKFTKQRANTEKPVSRGTLLADNNTVDTLLLLLRMCIPKQRSRPPMSPKQVANCQKAQRQQSERMCLGGPLIHRLP